MCIDLLGKSMKVCRRYTQIHTRYANMQVDWNIEKCKWAYGGVLQDFSNADIKQEKGDGLKKRNIFKLNLPFSSFYGYKCNIRVVRRSAKAQLDL